MRSPQEENEFLERGRFGEGEQSPSRIRVDGFLWIGLLFLAAAGACLGSTVVFRIGRDDGGPFF